jgi:hypothetical protein
MPKKEAASARWLALAERFDDADKGVFALNGIPLSGKSFRLMFQSSGGVTAALRICGG